MIPIAQQFAYPPGTKPIVKYSDFNCQGDASVSCSCTYNIGLTVPDKGAWVTSGSVLTLFSETEALPYVSDYTAAGNQLQLVGHEGTDVLGQRGLRTLVFNKQ
jgi:hypothetical protein